MPYTIKPESPLSPTVATAAEAHLLRHQMAIWQRVDRLLAGLLAFEWIAGMALAAWRSPRTWQGAVSSVNPHLWAAVVLGFIIISLPIGLALLAPGRTVTRHTVAIGQMLMSALLIHLGDGRIEMHFHIFGSLAFIAFYRDWRVLVTASVVVVMDHLIRGIYLPESIYGVMSASLWRSLEHGGWVVFEDIFLVGSCIQAVREMHGIALNRALLEDSYHNVENQVAQRTEELKNAQADLLKSARTAGMAEIAISVLHNVGNVLNSVNVSATLVADKLRQSEVTSLEKVSQMLSDHQTDIAGFLTRDERGKMIPEFITELATCLSDEQTVMLKEVQSLSLGIDHIKKIVASQQSMAKNSQLNTCVDPASLVQTAISMQNPSGSTAVKIHRLLSKTPQAMLDQHKVLQILINLISNAWHAVMQQPIGQREITLAVEPILSPGADRLRFSVRDNGVGIPAENLTRVFSHGFTTKKEGHGFGLHSAANAAREMRGSLSVTSDGPGKGAVFTLEIPVSFITEGAPCQT